MMTLTLSFNKISYVVMRALNFRRLLPGCLHSCSLICKKYFKAHHASNIQILHNKVISTMQTSLHTHYIPVFIIWTTENPYTYNLPYSCSSLTAFQARKCSIFIFNYYYSKLECRKYWQCCCQSSQQILSKAPFQFTFLLN